METILNLDKAVFLYLNKELTSPFLDALMPFITDKGNFVGVIIVAIIAIMIFGRRKDRLAVLGLALAVLLGDFFAGVIKDLVGRTRPCHALEGVRLLTGCGGSYSFPSSHATNIFAAMVYLSARYLKLSPAFLVVAVSVAYSRVYVGVHYPLDIIGGALLGSAIALSIYWAESFASRTFVSARGRGGRAENESG